MLGKLSVAVGAFEGFDSVVAEHVSLQTVQSDEAFGTLCAQIRPFSCVRARVHVEVTLAGEALPAMNAGVWRLTGVSPSVQHQLP